MTIRELQERSHATSREKGWWDNPRPIPEMLALIHSEVSEALEDYRKGLDVKSIHYSGGTPDAKPKPEGFPIELADILIRVADMAEALGIDLEDALHVKMAYNKMRPYRHGGKVI